MVFFEALPILQVVEIMKVIEVAARAVQESTQRLQNRAEDTQPGPNDPAQQFQQILSQLTQG
jgi:hypothetical protein